MYFPNVRSNPLNSRPVAASRIDTRAATNVFYLYNTAFLDGFHLGSWVSAGVTLAGAVHDFVTLSASVRSGGKSLAAMARQELGTRAGSVATLAIFFTVTVSISAMSFAVVKILEGSPWALFTISMTVPIALLMGAIMRGESHGPRLKLASVLGVGLLLFAVVYGDTVAHSRLAPYLSLSFGTLVACVAAYGLLASVLPVWLLLVPRVAGASEWFDLDEAGQAALARLTLALAQALKQATAADKINIGALGNVVAQLHVHIVARHRTDPAWPAPVWGRSEAPIDEAAESARRETLRALVDQISRSMPGRASEASQP